MPIAIKSWHASQVFYAVFVEPGLTQAELCKRAELDKSTVSLAVRQLEQAGLVKRQRSVAQPRRGRPGEGLFVAQEGKLLAGIHITQHAVSFALSTLDAEVLATHVESLSGQSNEIVKTVKSGLAAICCKAQYSPSDVISVGVSVPGMVDDEGEIVLSPPLNWRGVPLRQLLADAVDVPTFVENDTNALAVAEHFGGAAKHISDFVMIETGAGVGGGLFLSGRVYRGPAGLAGEIGHMKVVPGGRACHCGARGCLAAYVSDGSLLDRARERGLDFASIKSLADAWDRKEVNAIELMEETAEIFVCAASSLTNLFGPNQLLLAGGVSTYWHCIEPRFLSELPANCLGDAQSLPEVKVTRPIEDRASRCGLMIALHGLTTANITRQGA